MTVSYALLGLLEEATSHGYDLKQSYDAYVPTWRAGSTANRSRHASLQK